MKKLGMSVAFCVLSGLLYFVVSAFLEKFRKKESQRTMSELLLVSVIFGLGFGVGYYFFFPE